MIYQKPYAMRFDIYGAGVGMIYHKPYVMRCDIFGDGIGMNKSNQIKSNFI